MIVFCLFLVAKHNKEDDMWIIINGVVYDVTDFLPGKECVSAIVFSLNLNR
jgi:cytochrome b involved in lipid metabolism